MRAAGSGTVCPWTCNATARARPAQSAAQRATLTPRGRDRSRGCRSSHRNCKSRRSSARRFENSVARARNIEAATMPNPSCTIRAPGTYRRLPGSRCNRPSLSSMRTIRCAVGLGRPSNAPSSDTPSGRRADAIASRIATALTVGNVSPAALRERAAAVWTRLPSRLLLDNRVPREAA